MRDPSRYHTFLSEPLPDVKAGVFSSTVSQRHADELAADFQRHLLELQRSKLDAAGGSDNLPPCPASNKRSS